MAKKQNPSNHFLPLETQIEVISIKGDKVIKKTNDIWRGFKFKKSKWVDLHKLSIGVFKF